MMGKSHIVAGICSTELVWAAGRALRMYQGPGSGYILDAMDAAGSYLAVPDGIPWPIHMGTCLGLLLLGSVLPDIDSRNSILGRYVHLPVEHHTWTHAVYIPTVLAFFAVWYRSVFWLLAGYMIHLFWDSLSAQGVCWFYKILSDYREYPSGAKVKRGHKMKLYKTGKTSEYVLLGILVTLSVLSAAAVLYIRFSPAVSGLFG